jgi:dUTP pyrophosphatase
MMKISIVSKSGRLPSYETPGSSGMDLQAYLPEGDLVIKAGSYAEIPTGLYMEIPEGYEAQIRARSGLALKYGIGLVNGIGTIDSDYRGEIRILLLNMGKEPFIVHDGDRVAQMVISEFVKAKLEQKGELSETDRGSGGFGHTGI